jgi:hypothetical protein
VQNFRNREIEQSTSTSLGNEKGMVEAEKKNKKQKNKKHMRAVNMTAGCAPVERHLPEVVVFGITVVRRIQPLDKFLCLACNFKGNRWQLIGGCTELPKIGCSFALRGCANEAASLVFESFNASASTLSKNRACVRSTNKVLC